MPIDNVELFQIIYRRAQKELVPKLRVDSKKAFWIHTLINKILNIVYPKNQKDAYLKRFTTTLGFSVALATTYGTDIHKFDCWETLCHEIKHACQALKWTRIIMGYWYLWPLSQGILLLFTCWLPIFWASGWKLLLWISVWCIVAALHFIPQLPDPWRKHWELQAYSISMYLYFLVNKYIPKEYIESLATNFNSMAYYIMEPNKQKIEQELFLLALEIKSGRSPIKNEPIVIIAEEEYNKLRTC